LAVAASTVAALTAAAMVGEGTAAAITEPPGHARIGDNRIYGRPATIHSGSPAGISMIGKSC
jgi:hypothetical protein